MNTEDAFFTSARVCDQVYARRRALKEGRKPFLGLFGGAPEVEGEVEYVAALSGDRRELCLMMVNTKSDEAEVEVRLRGRQFAAPTYRAVTCPAEHVDDRVIPGEGHHWRQVGWEDAQTGYETWSNWEALDGGQRYEPLPLDYAPKCDVMKVRIAPHTVQSVTVMTRNAPKK